MLKTKAFGAIMSLVALGLVKKDVKCIGSTLLITLCMLVLVHVANLALNHFFAENQILGSSGELLQVNYMYTLKPENPLLALFWSLIPVRFGTCCRRL